MSFWRLFFTLVVGFVLLMILFFLFALIGYALTFGYFYLLPLTLIFIAAVAGLMKLLNYVWWG